MDKAQIIESQEEISINSFEELTEYVQPFRKNGKWIFRGVSDCTYDLTPKIGRPESRKDRKGNNLPYDTDSEKTLIRHFIRSASPYVQHMPDSQLEWLALAQHHGMFTRLLDWTESLLVAAYFAVQDARKKMNPPMIYGVRDIPHAPNEKIDTFEKLGTLDDVALYYPPHISPRIPAQSSVFTVHKSPNIPFKPDKIIRIKIASAPLTLKFNLNACGINKASLFPDINGLAEYQSWLYKWGEHLQYAD